RAEGEHGARRSADEERRRRLELVPEIFGARREERVDSDEQESERPEDRPRRPEPGADERRQRRERDARGEEDDGAARRLQRSSQRGAGIEARTCVRTASAVSPSTSAPGARTTRWRIAGRKSSFTSSGITKPRPRI